MNHPTRPDATDPRRLVTLAHLLRDAATDLRQAEPPASLPAQRVAEVLTPRTATAPWSASPAAGPAGGGASGTTAALGPGPGRSAGRDRWPGPGARWRLTGGLLLVAAVVAVLALRPGNRDRPTPPPLSAEFGTAFLPVGSAADWPRAAPGDPGLGWVVRADLPRERLALFGLPFDPARAGDRVPAELLLNPEGDVLAVRLLR